ncbi:hypothetical protein CZ794_12175 [Psychrobacter sp. JB385]|nr:hypothetical protein CZ794_12175 [Psychrobacter sp. JB385]
MGLARLPQNQQTLTTNGLSFSCNTDDEGESFVSIKPFKIKALHQLLNQHLS